MNSCRFALIVAGIVLSALAVVWVWADKPSSSATKTVADTQALAAVIDQQISARWAAVKVQPAELADDAEFMRRIYLDLNGRIPTVSEARGFLDDSSPAKRERLVERLLASPAYLNHFTNVWRALLMPEVNSSFELRALAPSFESWLRKKITENSGYDQIVREILTVNMTGQNQPRLNPRMADESDPTPIAFYTAKEVKPENLAASTARLFLGIRLECAQCHNHPFASWKQTQFWEYAAFFAGLQKQGENGNLFGAVREIHDRREIAFSTAKGDEQIVQAGFPDGTEPRWKFKVGSRVTLADWMTAPENPYFARAVVNRMWAHFFGVGFVEPVDNLDSDNPPSHPELLNELAKQFAAHQYDFKFLIRAITASRTYQLSSASSNPSQDDPPLFSRMAVRGLSPEQIFDSLALAVGYRDSAPRELRRFDAESPRAAFLAKFTDQGEKKTEIQTSILQALSLMNGKLIAEATDLEKSETLASVADAPFWNTEQRIETLYLAALARKPRSAESARLVKYVDAGGTEGDAKKALADVFWALLNSAEFILNH